MTEQPTIGNALKSLLPGKVISHKVSEDGLVLHRCRIASGARMPTRAALSTRLDLLRSGHERDMLINREMEAILAERRVADKVEAERRLKARGEL